MRRFAAIALFSAWASVAQAETPPAGAAEAAVLAAESAVAAAQVQKDPAAFEAALAEDFSFHLPNGDIVTRARFVNDLRTWWSPKSIDYSGQTVRVRGDAAVVTGKARIVWPNDKGQLEETVESYTDVYRREGGRWLKWASHTSCISGRCS